MTPEMNTAKIAYNDAPDDFKEKLASEVLSLTESECGQLLAFIKSIFVNGHLDS